MAATTGQTLVPRATHGYSTYLEYLEAIKDKWPEYEGLRSYLASHNSESESILGIRDVLSDGSYIKTERFQLSHIDNVAEIPTTARASKDALLSYPDNVRTRFVIISPQFSWDFDPYIVDAVGLALDIEPLFFWSIIARPDEAPPQHPEFLKLGNTHIKLLERELPASETVSICIVVHHSNSRASRFIYTDYIREFDRWRKSQFLVSENPSLYDHDTQHTNPSNMISGFRLLDMLDWVMCGQNDDSSESDLLRTLCIIANMHMVEFKTNVNSRPRVLEDPHNKTISMEWTWLRSALEDFRLSVRALRRFMSRNFEESRMPDALRDVLGDVRADQEDARADAEALEQELRDSLQMHVGRLSLEESRRSIEEGKRVKLRKFHSQTSDLWECRRHLLVVPH
ncbi:hypothetical protein MMC13_004372 [Lambiella insularis]|nr:hypothetical protein [Lambiella insularis]